MITVFLITGTQFPINDPRRASFYLALGSLDCRGEHSNGSRHPLRGLSAVSPLAAKVVLLPRPTPHATEAAGH